MVRETKIEAKVDGVNAQVRRRHGGGASQTGVASRANGGGLGAMRAWSGGCRRREKGFAHALRSPTQAASAVQGCGPGTAAEATRANAQAQDGGVQQLAPPTPPPTPTHGVTPLTPHP
jgi:hypothetical protein